MKVLRNLCHGFAPLNEIGLTVRRGTKWHAAEPGERLALSECRSGHEGDCTEARGCINSGIGLVVGTFVYRFSDIPAKLIELEHEESSRTYSGLFRSMNRAYSNFSAFEYVTLLVYRREE